MQSTYDYDPDTDRLTVHRSKEEADDYRYFPEPDLVPVEPPAELVERLRGQLARAAGRPHPAARGGARLRRGGRARDDRQRGEGRGAGGARASSGRRPRRVAMNRGDFLLENAPALAKIVQANVTREALDEAFAAAASGPIEADDYLARRRSATSPSSCR